MWALTRGRSSFARPTESDAVGSFAYENWRASLVDQSPGEALEYPLFGDVPNIAGDIDAGLGPYKVLNCIATPYDVGRAVLALQVDYHATATARLLSVTDASRYHGGIDADEIAALLSLGLGIRLKAGSPTRWFKPGEDPRGRPWSFQQSGRPDPTVTHSSIGKLIPRLQRQVVLTEVPPQMFAFHALAPADSVSLIRAARLYQDGVWLADAEPSLAWLMLVSAVEAAAERWHTGKTAARDRLRDGMPDLERLLVAAGGDALADQVARMIGHTLKATKKFLDFCIAFLPPPAEPRPAEYSCLDWSVEGMKRALQRVYDYRSIALHAGTPFPLPMCYPPLAAGDAPAERLPGNAMAGFGGMWLSRDVPMFLHTFEHIARNCLLAWWASLILTDEAGVSEDRLKHSREPGVKNG